MPPRSPIRSRERSLSRSRTRSPYDQPRSRSPRRSISPRSISRSPLRSVSPRDRTNGHHRSRSYSRSRSPSNGAQTPPRSSKIVVERLTKNVNDGHLWEIFGEYGKIRDVQLPMNKQFMTNRGTAYILYETMAEAEAAIAHMHEAQLDGAVISVSVVLPRRRFSVSPPPSRRVAAHEARTAGQRGGRGGFGRPPARYRSPPGRRSPPPRYRDPPRRRENLDEYRPRSYSRSRSPYRSRSSSMSSRSLSRSPPPRRYRRRGSTPPPARYGGDRRRRSSSFSSQDSRSNGRRSWSRDRGPRTLR